MDALLVSTRPAFWDSHKSLFEQAGLTLSCVPSLALALELFHTQAPALVVLDLPLPEQEQRAAVIAMLERNAFTLTALVSTLAPEVFHETMEGLGLLGSLPLQPSAGEIIKLLEQFTAVHC